MELDLHFSLTNEEVSNWVEHAVAHGWKRPRSWAKMERQAAVVYGIQCAIGCTTSEEISALIEQRLTELIGPETVA